jgi:hypothetical protein
MRCCNISTSACRRHKPVILNRRRDTGRASCRKPAALRGRRTFLVAGLGDDVFFARGPGREAPIGEPSPRVSLLSVHWSVRAWVSVVNMNSHLLQRFKVHLNAVTILYQFTEGNNSDKSVRKDSFPRSIRSGCDLLPPAFAASNHMLLFIPYSSDQLFNE